MDQVTHLYQRTKLFLWSYFDVDEITVKSSFLKLGFLEAGNAKGILEGIDNAFKSIGIENFYERLVGFGADGASVNRVTRRE